MGLRSAGRRRGARGATLIEISIVALLLFTLLLSVFEFGLLFRDQLTASDAVADASRLGAIVGPDTTPGGYNADYQILKAMREGLSALNDDAVESIVVFRASGTDDEPLSQLAPPCKAGVSIANECNVYDPATAFAAVDAGDAAYFTCTPATPASCPYNPSNRIDGPTRADIESIGVYIRIVKPGYTGLFRDEWVIARASIVRLEPGVVE